MIDDTRDASSPGSFRLSGQIDAILQHSVHRSKSDRWARNLRFLTFDDSPLDHPPESSEPREHRKAQCSWCEQRIPPPAGHMCVTHEFPCKRDEWEKQRKRFSDPCVHVENLTCEDCQHIPLFPTNSKVTRFRIRRLRPKDVQPDDLSPCSHFLAVSHCWASQPNSAPENDLQKVTDEPYMVVEEDGTIRPMRAQKVTIDRVVDYATQNGYRMIWIDQVRLPKRSMSQILAA